jgi:hypothetical protein
LGGSDKYVDNLYAYRNVCSVSKLYMNVSSLF